MTYDLSKQTQFLEASKIFTLLLSEKISSANPK